MVTKEEVAAVAIKSKKKYIYKVKKKEEIYSLLYIMKRKRKK
jgi:hypothetical protein